MTATSRVDLSLWQIIAMVVGVSLTVSSIAFSWGLYVGKDASSSERVERNAAIISRLTEQIQSLAVTASANANRVDNLEKWRGDIALLADSRDQRLRAVEGAITGNAADLNAIKVTLARIEDRLDNHPGYPR